MSCLYLAALGVVFLGYRLAFHSLPLHMDTAFYVPNRVVAGKGWGVFSGWNAHFSAASRLLPQLVHSAVFRAAGPAYYASSFRWVYAVIVYLTALITGFLVETLVGDHPLSPLAAYSSVIAYLLLASETQYGAYFESAEIFQVVFQTIGILLCVLGISEDQNILIAIGVGSLWIDAVLIKLTGTIQAFMVSIAIAWHRPSQLWWLVVLAAVAMTVYAALLKASGGRLIERLRYLRRHENHIRRKYPSCLKLVIVKLLFMLRLVIRNPAIPLVSVAAVFVYPLESSPSGEVGAVIVVYAISVFVGFLQQGHRVWYYAVPFFPLVAILFAFAVQGVALKTSAWNAGIVSCGALVISVLINLLPRLFLDIPAFTHWVFSVYNRPGGRFGDSMAQRNLSVASAATVLRRRVQGRSMLVLGSYNQASVLVGAAYDTPLASICELAEGTSGNLERFLVGIEADPPEFVLDTEGVFENYRRRWPWLVPYQLVADEAQVQLYERKQS